MDPFETPGDPGDPGDRGAILKIHKEHYMVTATQREKVNRPKRVEHQRNANVTNKYKKGNFWYRSAEKEADEAEAASNLSKRHSNNISIIERLLKNHAEWELQIQQRQTNRNTANEGADDIIPTETDNDTGKANTTVDTLLQRMQQQQHQQQKEMEEQQHR